MTLPSMRHGPETLRPPMGEMCHEAVELGPGLGRGGTAHPLAELLQGQPPVPGGRTEPLEGRAVKRGAVVLRVAVEPGQRLAGSCAPECQLAVVIGGRDIDHDLGQPAVVTHPVNLRGLAVRQRILHQPHAASARSGIAAGRDGF
jgi:hypothetical protein